MRFSFVGQLEFNTKEDAKVPAIRKIGDSGLGVNATVVSAKNNRAYVELAGWQNDTILTRDTDGNNIEINWDDRFDENIIKSVANYRKCVIDIGDEKKTFVSEYDLCVYIRDHINSLNNKRFAVTGQTEENVYNGTVSKRFKINSLYAVDENSDRKNKLEISTVMYWDKDGVDTADFKDEKKIYVNGYTQEYMSKRDLGTEKGAMRYVPIQFVLDCSKIDFDNENHVKMMNANLMNLGLTYKDDKVSNKLKSGKYYSNEIVISYYNGAKDMGDASEITYDMLTDFQKMKVDCGMAKPEDFAAKGRAFGDRIVEYRITSFPNLTGTYENGFVTLEDSVEDFEDMIFRPASQKEVETEIDDEVPFDMPKPTEEKKSKKNKTESKNEEKPKEDEKDNSFTELFG